MCFGAVLAGMKYTTCVRNPMHPYPQHHSLGKTVIHKMRARGDAGPGSARVSKP